MLEVRNLSKIFFVEEKQKEIFSSLSLFVEEGKMTSIIGTSGCGKSTLLNIITGMLSPTKGDIFWQGNRLKKRNYSRLRGKEIGYVWQGQSLLENFTVLDNVCFPYYINGGKEDVFENGLQVLKQIGMEHLANVTPSQVSGGEAKRAAIARALLLNPSLLVADEPTNNLDEENRRKIIKLFKKLKQQGMTILCSTHDKDLMKASDIVYELKDKRIQKVG